MAENSGKNNSIRWIILLCITAVIAVVGWTTTANLAARMRTLDEIKQTSAQVVATQQANNVRISVLENKYDTIQATLVEIKVLIQKYMDRE